MLKGSILLLWFLFSLPEFWWSGVERQLTVRHSTHLHKASSILSPLFIACHGEMQDFPFPLRLRLCWTLNVIGSGTRIKGQRLAGGVGTIPGGFQCPCVTSLRASFLLAFNVENSPSTAATMWEQSFIVTKFSAKANLLMGYFSPACQKIDTVALFPVRLRPTREDGYFCLTFSTKAVLSAVSVREEQEAAAA